MHASIARVSCNLQHHLQPPSHGVPPPFRSTCRHPARTIARADLDIASSADIIQSSSSDIIQSSSTDIIQSTADALQVAPGVLAIGAAAVGLGVAGLIWVANKNQQSMGPSTAGDETAAAAPAVAKPENAVLVFGSTGKLGRLIVKQLLAAGRNVVAAARSDEKAAVFEELSSGAAGKLFVRSGVDITDAATLTPELLEGVTQIVSAVGPVFGRSPDGKMGYLDNMTSERVDAGGVSNVAELAKQLPRVADAAADVVLSMRTAEDLQAWERKDDVIMGGSSSSQLEAGADGGGAVWSGDLIVQGGGFCGARTFPQPLDLSGYSGIQLRVRGDGQTYKLNLKTADQEDAPESTYQATFDTIAGDWVTVNIPWHEFVPVKRAQVDRSKPAVNPGEVRQFGLVLSRFEYNGYANPNYRPGQFKLEVAEGIRAFRAAVPQLVMVSSAAVERNAIIGDDEEARKQDVPIVQLNPGGVLNHKYTGENAVRGSGLPYTVVRAVGLTTEDADTDFLLEARQGDSISGKISRDEVAALVAAALGTTTASGKTFEARRSEAADAKGKTMSQRQVQQLFLGLEEDRLRPRVGLLPFPKAVPPPPTPSEDRKQEILSDERVQAAQKAGRGGRVRSEQETAAASSVTVVGDGRPEASSSPESQPAKEWIGNWRARQSSTDGGGPSDNGSNGSQASAKEWIGSWRSRQEGTNGSNGSDGDQMPAKEWIENWRKRQQ